MDHKDTIRIQHIKEAAEKAIDIFNQFEKGEIKDDEVVLLSVSRCFSIIGEAANKVSEQTCKQHTDIPWRDMIDMRNRLVHVYYDMDWRIIEAAVKQELPPLLEQLNQIK